MKNKQRLLSRRYGTGLALLTMLMRSLLSSDGAAIGAENPLATNLPSNASESVLATLPISNSSTSGVAATETAPASMPEPNAATQERVRNALGKLPLHFKVNTDQTDEHVKFQSRTGG